MARHPVLSGLEKKNGLVVKAVARSVAVERQSWTFIVVRQAVVGRGKPPYSEGFLFFYLGAILLA
jgi:hypothetical protein